MAGIVINFLGFVIDDYISALVMVMLCYSAIIVAIVIILATHSSSI